MHEAIGLSIRQILRSGESVNPHELIGTLWRLRESSADVTMREACNRAIRLLASKLN